MLCVCVCVCVCMRVWWAGVAAAEAGGGSHNVHLSCRAMIKAQSRRPGIGSEDGNLHNQGEAIISLYWLSVGHIVQFDGKKPCS